VAGIHARVRSLPTVARRAATEAERSSVPFPLLDPKLVVLRFNEAINVSDIDRLTPLMTEDHCFIDSAGNETRGRAAARHA
jgi:hypothetical protein